MDMLNSQSFNKGFIKTSYAAEQNFHFSYISTSQKHQRGKSPSLLSFNGKSIYFQLKNFMLNLWKIVVFLIMLIILSDTCFYVKSATAYVIDNKVLNSSFIAMVQPQALVTMETTGKSNRKWNTSNSSRINNDYKSVTTMITTLPSTTVGKLSMVLLGNGYNYRNTSTNDSDCWNFSSPILVPLPSSSPTSTTSGELTLPALQTVILCMVLLFIISGTIIGNILVCIAVCMVRKLRRPSNYLLVSLALSDLCVATLVMPMAMLYEVLQTWIFGPILCDIWVSFDMLSCTASILNLCAISVDRYMAITKPLEYAARRTPRNMMLCVALVWLMAAFISLPPLLILGNEHFDENGNVMCSVCQNSTYQIYATLGSFYIPLGVMLFVYFQIYRAARRIALDEKRTQRHLQFSFSAIASSSDHAEADKQRHSSYDNASLNFETCGGKQARGSGTSGLLALPHQKKLRFQLANEKKASTTLGIIMSAFIICWLPFFLLALIRPFVETPEAPVPPMVSSIFLWLGYANSLLNPIIYATLNRDFRKPFKEILYFRCCSLNAMMRENYYQDQYGEPASQRVMLGDDGHGRKESYL